MQNTDQNPQGSYPASNAQRHQSGLPHAGGRIAVEQPAQAIHQHGTHQGGAHTFHLPQNMSHDQSLPARPQTQKRDGSRQSRSRHQHQASAHEHSAFPTPRLNSMDSAYMAHNPQINPSCNARTHVKVNTKQGLQENETRSSASRNASDVSVVGTRSSVHLSTEMYGQTQASSIQHSHLLTRIDSNREQTCRDLVAPASSVVRNRHDVRPTHSYNSMPLQPGSTDLQFSSNPEYHTPRAIVREQMAPLTHHTRKIQQLPLASHGYRADMLSSNDHNHNEASHVPNMRSSRAVVQGKRSAHDNPKKRSVLFRPYEITGSSMSAYNTLEDGQDSATGLQQFGSSIPTNSVKGKSHTHKTNCGSGASTNLSSNVSKCTRHPHDKRIVKQPRPQHTHFSDCPNVQRSSLQVQHHSPVCQGSVNGSESSTHYGSQKHHIQHSAANTTVLATGTCMQPPKLSGYHSADTCVRSERNGLGNIMNPSRTGAVIEQNVYPSANPDCHVHGHTKMRKSGHKSRKSKKKSRRPYPYIEAHKTGSIPTQSQPNSINSLENAPQPSTSNEQLQAGQLMAYADGSVVQYIGMPASGQDESTPISYQSMTNPNAVVDGRMHQSILPKQQAANGGAAPLPQVAASMRIKENEELAKPPRTKGKTKQFPCTWEGCEKKFARQDHATRHLNTHTGERPHKCTWKGCDKSFNQTNNLERHVRTHIGERPHKCTWEGCTKAFTEAGNLTRHMLLHTEARPATRKSSGDGKGKTCSKGQSNRLSPRKRTTSATGSDTASSAGRKKSSKKHRQSSHDKPSEK